ncbi:hypothetical protein [Asaia sp. VD9]|uniref:hypothetical protein n=1 Tax=Asaia sp. VD9 TaxID=3081235 RepID=UPI003016B299
MRTVRSIESEIETKRKAAQAAKARIAALKRSLAKEHRRREAQALCALGRGVLSLYDDVPDARASVASYLARYLNRDSDLVAAEDTLSDRALISALTVPPDIPVEVVG